MGPGCGDRGLGAGVAGGEQGVFLPKRSGGAGVIPGGLAVPADEGFRVIETFGWDGRRFPRLGAHMARLGRTCDLLGIDWEPMEVLVRLDALKVGRPDQVPDQVPDRGPVRVRVTVDRAGLVGVSHGAVVPVAAPWRVTLAAGRLASGDPWLRVKTTERRLYDAARSGLAAGLDEVVFANERDEVCEGSIASVFFDAGAGLCTPPLACGLLPGVLRDEMLTAGQCRAAVLRVADLGRVRLWLGNSLRGMVRAKWVGSRLE